MEDGTRGQIDRQMHGMITGRGERVSGDREPHQPPSTSLGLGEFPRPAPHPGEQRRDWPGMKLPANISGRWSFGRGLCGPQGNKGSRVLLGIPWVQLSVENRLAKALGPFLDGGAHLGSLGSHRAAPLPAREKREMCPHPPLAWGPMGWEFLSIHPPPIKKFHGGCFLPAFEEKTLCLKLPFLCEAGNLCFL